MNYKREVSAGGIVFKKQGADVVWLVTKHSQFGHWSFPKGLVGDVDESEDTKNAALREVGEEGGVEAEVIKKLSEPVNYTYKWKDRLIKKTVHYYLMRYISGDPKNHDWEVSEAKFLPAEKVKEILTHENDKKAFAEARKLLVAQPKALHLPRHKLRK